MVLFHLVDYESSKPTWRWYKRDARRLLRGLNLLTKKTAMNQNATKSRYSDEELEEFRVLIQEKLDKAKRELAFYTEQMEDLADNPDAKVKGLDDGIGTMESEQLISLAARHRKHIQHLENALVRIKNKAYGVCRITGKLIAKERLRAVPHATLSIEAKESRQA